MREEKQFPAHSQVSFLLGARTCWAGSRARLAGSHPPPNASRSTPHPEGDNRTARCLASQGRAASDLPEQVTPLLRHMDMRTDRSAGMRLQVNAGWRPAAVG